MTDSEFLESVEALREELVRSTARYYKLCRADAEDIVQNVVIRAWKKYNTCRGPLRLWLIASCFNEAKDLIKSRDRYTTRLEKAGVVKGIKPSLY